MNESNLQLHKHGTSNVPEVEAVYTHSHNVDDL